MAMQNLKVSAVQMHHLAGDKAHNLRKMHLLIQSAAAAGVQLLVFPEMCITGYWHVRNLTLEEIADLAEPVPDGPSCQQLLTWSMEYEISIGAGLIEAAPGGLFYNTYAVAMPDGRVERHRKIHAFEHDAISCGNEFTVFDTLYGWRIGILICYDNNIGENARITALKGADILLAPHQTGGCDSRSPCAMGLIDPQLWHNRAKNPDAIEAEFAGPKGRAWLMRWLPARAHDNGMFLVFSNGVGEDDGEVRTGNAMVLDPYGRIITESTHADDDMVTADLDPALLRMCTGRRWLQVRRPELYHPLTQPTGNEKTTREVRFAADVSTND
jgi:predicted amidohydrolase